MNRSASFLGSLLLLFTTPLLHPPEGPPSQITLPSPTPTPPPIGLPSVTPPPSNPPTPTQPPPTATWTPTATVTPTPTVQIALPSPTPTPPGELVIPSATDTPFTFSYPSPTPTPTPLPFDAGDLPERNLEVYAMEVTQAIQDLHNSMPLVAGRRTYVRVYVRAQPTAMTDVTGQLGVWQGNPVGGIYLGTLSPVNGPITARPDGGDRLNLDDSLYFLLPQAWIAEGAVTLKAFIYAVDPELSIQTELNSEDNLRQVTIEFHPGAAPNVWFWPLKVHLDFDSGKDWLAFRASDYPAIFADIANSLFRYYPIAKANLYPMEEVFGPVSTPAWDLKEKPGQVLIDLGIKHDLDGRSDDEWYVGMVHLFHRPNLGGFLGFGNNKGAWVLMDPTTGLVDSHNTPWYIRGGWLLAHELGHTAGLDHVSCTGTEAGVDKNYPHPAPNCTLAEVNPEGFYGFDVYYDLFGLNEPTVISNDPSVSEPHLGFPLMGYKFPKYVDDYTYCKLLNHFGVPCDLYGGIGGGGSGGGAIAAECKPCIGNPNCKKRGSDLGILESQLELCPSQGRLPEPIVYLTNPEAFLTVTGEIRIESAQATIMELYALPPEVFDGTEAWEALREALLAAEEPTPFWLDLLDQEGRVLTSVPIVRLDHPHEPLATVDFLYTLPATDAVQAVVIRTLDGTELARAAASTSPPTVNITEIAAGTATTEPVTVSWQAEDSDGDPLEFIVQVSSDGGEQWETLAIGLIEHHYTLDPMGDIPGGDRPLVRVIASDGFNTAFDTQPLPQPIPGKPPIALILGPVDGAIFPTNGLVVLTGTASDLEDGPLPPEALSWHSDLDGDLGTGPEIATFDLSPGQHVITLRATDSNGQVTEARVRLAIDPNVVRARPDPAQVAAAERILREGLPAQPAPQTPVTAEDEPIPASAWLVLAAIAAAALFGLGLVLMALRRR